MTMTSYVFLFNGLGNQISQYAFGKYLERVCGNRVKYVNKCNKLHGFELKKVFNIEIHENLVESLLIKCLYYAAFYPKLAFARKVTLKIYSLLSINFFIDSTDYIFNSTIGKKKGGINIFIGGWSNVSYIEPVLKELQKELNFDLTNIGEKNKDILKKIHDGVFETCIHVRRGDYVEGPESDTYGGIADKNYYMKAITRNLVDDKKTCVFSGGPFTNDSRWFEENFPDLNVTYINWNSGENSYLDMFLMSRFPRKIIANSTFSIWAGLLSSDGDKVICPNKYTNYVEKTEVYLPSWIRIDD